MINPSIIAPLWIDAPDAEVQALVRTRSLAREDQRHIPEIIRDGFTVVPQAVDREICQRTADDFDAYLTQQSDYAAKHTDSLGRHYRFVNFHLASENAMKIGMTERVLQILDCLFGYKAAPYTCLYFEYGTGQPIHRDSPFFHTFPINYFVGVWTALEDIHPDAGPLTYVPGGHRWEIDHQAIFRQVKSEHPGQNDEWYVDQALQRYYGHVIDRANNSIAAIKVPLRIGDTAIWHAQTPHGGSPIVNSALKRKSIVFHCTPEDMQVYHQGVFFGHPPSQHPAPRFSYASLGNRKYAQAGQPLFAESY
jgi:phytanoyl-CoA hydroxylase